MVWVTARTSLGTTALSHSMGRTCVFFFQTDCITWCKQRYPSVFSHSRCI